jgi:Beta-galactosidase/beta-glucuronidase
LLIISFFICCNIFSQRTITNFNNNWKFYLGDNSGAINKDYDDSKWRTLDIPHDWSIEGSFSKDNPTTYNEGALPAGIGWYRKTFTVPSSSKPKRIYINFDGVYKNSEVWINGFYLGKRSNGYISFQYELTGHLNFGPGKNVVTVKVDNAQQPESRWYSGSGIYRNVWLVTTNKIAVNNWGIFVSTPKVTLTAATINVTGSIKGDISNRNNLSVTQNIYNASGELILSKTFNQFTFKDPVITFQNSLDIKSPNPWSPKNPYLYTLKTITKYSNVIVDEVSTTFGIRTFYFNPEKGFFLNGKPLKILGVCLHHDLGALGSAINKRAIERQLQILKGMGCNAIRTSHNPPAPELLDLCDKMGFMVMDEAFDMWIKRKNKFDYHLDFEKWHKQDLEDQIKRDRNHPSVFMWSIGNEIREQFDSSGIAIAKELVSIVKTLDNTRPVTSALTENIPSKNFIYRSGALDLLSFNYKLKDYDSLPIKFPGQKFIASETMSALATRGHYDMPSDSIRLWPPDSKSSFKGNDDLTVSSYDNAYAYWGSTHEDGWNAVKKFDFISGLFVWSGFDFLGEPVPYQWPARSSYYGIIDLAGFPKDAYYMYQSEWTNKPVLHIFPHWNWQPGKVIDVWAYYNNADEVELFLDGKSLGKKSKTADTLHVMWRVNYQPGTLKAVSRKNGKIVLSKEIKTAGEPAKIELIADRKNINPDGEDLSFVTARILDKDGNLVPYADDLINFKIEGEGIIAGVDNGLQTSMESFKANHRKAFNGLCLVIIRSKNKAGKIMLEATADGLRSSTTIIISK